MNMQSIKEQESPSFGRYLQRARVEKGISLQTVAKETRIGLNTLLLIENEDLDRLPAEVFTKGFLRAYAKVVGADGDDIVHRYLSDHNAHKAAVKFEKDLFKSGSRVWPRFFLAFILLGCIIALSLYFFNGFRFRTMDSPHDMPLESSEPSPAAVTEDTNVPEPQTEPADTAPKLLLHVVALKETWMKVIIDDRDAKEYRLNTGDRLELEASSGYNLLLGDAKGVELTLNDKPYKISGQDGQVVTLQISKPG